MPLQIRPALDDDAAAMAALCDQLGYASTPAEILERLHAIAASADHAALVATVEEAVVGWIHVFGAVRIESDAFAEIGGLVVAESQRGHGLGAALVAAAEAWAVVHGYRTMRVRSNVVRVRARRFYERHGYLCTKQSCVFTKPLAGP